MSIQEKAMYASFWKEMAKVNTCIPARIVNVRDNLSTMTVDVQPLVNMYKHDKTSTPWSTISNVPLIFPSSNTSAFTFKIEEGDTVLLVFSQCNIENFQFGTGTPASPVTFSKFNENDAIAIAGLFPVSKSINNPSKRRLKHNTKDTVVAHNIGTPNEIEIRLTEDGDIKITATKEVKIESPKVTAITEELNVQTETASITATDSASVTAPTTDWTGNISLTGSLSATMGITSSVSVGAPSLSASSSLTVAGKEMSGHSHPVVGVTTGNSTIISGVPI